MRPCSLSGGGPFSRAAGPPQLFGERTGARRRLTAFLAAVSGAAILGFLVARLVAAPAALEVLLLVAAVGATGGLLARLWLWAPGLGPPRLIRAHLLLHAVPASYLIFNLFAPAVRVGNALYLGPALLFFWTGRRTWRALHARTGSPLYRIFVRGNTGLLAGLPAFMAVAVFYDQALGATLFCRALCGYFTVHLLLVGVTALKLEADSFRIRQARRVCASYPPVDAP